MQRPIDSQRQKARHTPHTHSRTHELADRQRKNRYREKERERHTHDTDTEIHTQWADRQGKDRHRDRHTDRQTDRQTEVDKDRKTVRQIE